MTIARASGLEIPRRLVAEIERLRMELDAVSLTLSERTPKADDQLMEIYNLYPRKAARPAALKAIKSAIKKIGAERLKSEVQRYAEFHKASSMDLQFTPMPATWFNQERWDDTPKEAQVNQTTQRAQLSRIMQLRAQVRNSPAFPGGPYFVDFTKQETKDALMVSIKELKAINPSEDLNLLRQ